MTPQQALKQIAASIQTDQLPTTPQQIDPNWTIWRFGLLTHIEPTPPPNPTPQYLKAAHTRRRTILQAGHCPHCTPHIHYHHTNNTIHAAWPTHQPHCPANHPHYLQHHQNTPPPKPVQNHTRRR